MTKIFAILPVTLVVGVLACMVDGWRRRTELVGDRGVVGIRCCRLVFIQNTVRYGDPLARAVPAHYLSAVGGLGTALGVPHRIIDPLGLIFASVPARVFTGFWYESGWSQFKWPWPVNLLFWLALVAALAGLRA